MTELFAEIGRSRLEIEIADITTLDVEAIVNAANSSLLGGGGVDGAIHRAAGPELLEECRTLGGCDTGEAKITHGYRLKARARHPCGRAGVDGRHRRRTCAAGELLSDARSSSPAQHGLKSLAFPAISTGIYRFPPDLAARIAVGTVASELAGHSRGRSPISRA